MKRGRDWKRILLPVWFSLPFATIAGVIWAAWYGNIIGGLLCFFWIVMVVFVGALILFEDQ